MRRLRERTRRPAATRRPSPRRARRRAGCPARLAARQEYAVQPAVRDRPGVHDRHVARPFPRTDFAADPVPGDARPQLRELVRGIAAREHVEHALEGGARKIGEGRGPADEAVQVVDPGRRRRRDRDDLLCEDVEGVARVRASPRPCLPASAPWRPRPRGGRPDTSERGSREKARRRRVPRGRSAACPTRSTAGPRSGRRDPPRPCRCRARARTSPRSPAGRPRLSRSSISSRFSRATDPWCARAISSPAVSLSEPARRSASRRLLVKIIVER